MPRSLIIYSSRTGNTEKVAFTFKSVFERVGWQYDILKIDSSVDTDDPPFNYRDYDFLCVGSPIIDKFPTKEILGILSPRPKGESRSKEAIMKRMQKIVLGPEDKNGIVFVTYGGVHFGPKEAEPALEVMASEMEHLRFRCVGKFACPGKYADFTGYFKDLKTRPHERDLLKADIFLSEILEAID